VIEHAVLPISFDDLIAIGVIHDPPPVGHVVGEFAFVGSAILKIEYENDGTGNSHVNDTLKIPKYEWQEVKENN
jgi:hypothetical protein